MRKWTILLLYFCACCCCLSAQVSIIATPPLGSFRVNNLYDVSVSNIGGVPLMGSLRAELTTTTGEAIAAVETTVLSLEAGRIFSGIQLPWTNTIFSNNYAAEVLRSTDNLLPGNYLLCYYFTDSKDQSIIGEFCLEFTLSSLQDFELTAPYDGEEITSLFPLLVWDPYLTVGSGGSYQIVLKEVKKRQTPIEALAGNPPLLQLDNLLSNQLPYPPAALPLEEGKTYVWQVSVQSTSRKNLANSSVWTFTVSKPNTAGPLKSVSPTASYPLLSTHSKAVNYLNQGQMLKLAYDNWENKPYLDYNIARADYSGVVMTANELPSIPLTNGLNTIAIDISTVTGLVPDEEYCLFVYDRRGTQMMRLTIKQ